jgi:hypothetical protein
MFISTRYNVNETVYIFDRAADAVTRGKVTGVFASSTEGLIEVKYQIAINTKSRSFRLVVDEKNTFTTGNSAFYSTPDPDPEPVAISAEQLPETEEVSL